MVFLKLRGQILRAGFHFKANKVWLYEQEFEFYTCCGEALTSLTIFLLTSLIAVLGSSRGSGSRSISSCPLPTLITGGISFRSMKFYWGDPRVAALLLHLLPQAGGLALVHPWDSLPLELCRPPLSSHLSLGSQSAHKTLNASMLDHRSHKSPGHAHPRKLLHLSHLYMGLSWEGDQ